MSTKHIPHFRPNRRRRMPRDVDCFVLRQHDFPKGCWSLAGDDWSADVTLKHRALGLLDYDKDVVNECQLLVLRVGHLLGVKHKANGFVQEFPLVPFNIGVLLQCPRCRRRTRSLWMPARSDTLACRTCWNITYTSQRQDSYRYHLDAARLVEQQVHDEQADHLLPLLKAHAEQVNFIRNVEFMNRISKRGGMLGKAFQGVQSALQLLRE